MIYWSLSVVLLLVSSIAYSKRNRACKEECEEDDPCLPRPTHNSRRKIKFVLRHTEVNFMQAFERCLSEGKILASITNKKEDDKLRATLERYHAEGKVWLSGSDLAFKNNYTWMALGKPVTYTNWYASRVLDNCGRNCIYSYREKQNYYWMHMLCEKEAKFVCEYF